MLFFSVTLKEQTTVNLTLEISNDMIDHMRQSAIKAAIKGVFNGVTPPAIGPKDLCITPILKTESNPTCLTLKLSELQRNVYKERIEMRVEWCGTSSHMEKLRLCPRVLPHSMRPVWAPLFQSADRGSEWLNCVRLHLLLVEIRIEYNRIGNSNC
jgi:hypothetical protein